MDATTVLHALITIATVSLGILVFLTNRHRASNAAFLLLSLGLVAWLISLGVAFYTSDLEVAAFGIRFSNASGAFLLFASHALRVAIVHPMAGRRQVLRRTLIWLLLAAGNAALCFTPFFLREATISTGAGSAGIAEPVYGPGIMLYGAIQLLSLTVFMVRTGRGLVREKGIAKVELQFIMLACSVGLVLGTLNTVILPLVFRTSQIVKFVPGAAILFLGIVAYGIATRRIMEVGTVLRSITAYTLLLCYLVGLYVLTLYLSRFAFGAAGFATHTGPHFVAALLMAFSLTPAHGRMQIVASKLFVNAETTDVSLTVQRSNAVLQAIGTIDTLLARFSSVVQESVGAGDVTILLVEKGRHKQVFPQGRNELKFPGGVMQTDSPTIRTLALSPQPLIVDVLQRRHPTALLAAAGRELQGIGVAAAVGIRSKGDLRGVMLLGPRLSGRVYGLPEQRALQILGDQLATAVENATLYTQLQDGKIYNDILLDSLVSGVVATDSEQRVTVFNDEAERITGLRSDAIIGKPIEALPEALVRILEHTLTSGEGVRNRDARLLLSDGETVPIQVGSSVFYGHEGAVSGVLLVFNDLSVVKLLETQVRRTAHLASVGTLSAGMAHEIKNPLQSLKTFSQLMDEQFEDPEFRKTFSDLLMKAVTRIDRIVNQLLKFGRPAKAQLVEISLQEVVEQSLQLVQVPMRKKGVDLKLDWHVKSSVTAGDPRLLEQAFVNFFLNAIDAMEGGGELRVILRLVREPLPNAAEREDILPDRHLSVSIQDSGIGISEEDLPQVFNPFFTTKSTGTGLGLSVVHSIIQEHGGMIDVESEKGVGTTFHVLYPVVRRGVYSESADAQERETDDERA